MLDIAGGAYLEYCVEPHWSQLYGSGVRAAASLSRLSRKITLHTYISRQYDRTLKIIANSFGFELDSKDVSKSVSFSYLHGLSDPKIDPQVRFVEHPHPFRVVAENILRFGFIEQDAIVHGKKVVFDPQSMYQPREFSENGSTAERLAIISNFYEASVLTGETELRRMGRKLISGQKAEIAIIKRGPLGAALFSKKGLIEVIPPYKTEFVWPIGSGDVYSSAFAHFWAEKNFTPLRAAKLASIAAAIFCNSRSLPLSPDFMKGSLLKPLRLPKHRNRRIYLAGPFFTMAQRWLVEEARICLQKFGLPVFSPYHDVGLGVASDVVPLDIQALNRADVVFLLADGLDAGTIFEAGHARARGIPVIVFVQNEKEGDLKMLRGTNCEMIDDFVTAIYRTVWLALES